VDRDLEIASQKARAQILGLRVAKSELHVRMAGSNIGYEVDDLVWRDRAHDSQFERPPCRERLREVLRQRRVIVDGLKVWADQSAKIGEVRRFALAAKKQPSKLLFEKLDRARQGGLRHIALLAGAGEIQR